MWKLQQYFSGRWIPYVQLEQRNSPGGSEKKGGGLYTILVDRQAVNQLYLFFVSEDALSLCVLRYP